MSDHLHTQPDEHLEARITAYVLGEASPFESAELEELISKSPELQLFLNRTRTLHTLLKEAETTANTPAEDWKLPTAKREKLDALLGEEKTVISLKKESRIRRASFRAAIGIAAVFIVTLIISRLYVFPDATLQTESTTIVNYMSASESEPQLPSPSSSDVKASQQADAVVNGVPTLRNSRVIIGGQVRSPQAIEKENLTLGEAIVRAGGATEFGSRKRVKVRRDGEIQTYDLTNPRFRDVILQPGDTVEVPQKNWLGCGAGRDELVEAEATPTPAAEPNSGLAVLTDGLRSGDASLSDTSIDAILNNPDRMAGADSEEKSQASPAPSEEQSPARNRNPEPQPPNSMHLPPRLPKKQSRPSPFRQAKNPSSKPTKPPMDALYDEASQSEIATTSATAGEVWPGKEKIPQIALNGETKLLRMASLPSQDSTRMMLRVRNLIPHFSVNVK